MKKAKDMMTLQPYTIDINSTFETVLHLMKTHKIGNIPVTENGKLIGIITRDEMLEHNEAAPQPPVTFFWDIIISLAGTESFQKKLKHVLSYALRDFYSTRYLLVDQESSAEELITTMIEKKYSCAIVGTIDNIVGIITRSDLIEKSF